MRTAPLPPTARRANPPLLALAALLLVSAPGIAFAQSGASAVDEKPAEATKKQTATATSSDRDGAKATSGQPSEAQPTSEKPASDAPAFVDRDGDGIQDGQEHRFRHRRGTSKRRGAHSDDAAGNGVHVRSRNGQGEEGQHRGGR